MSEATVHFRVPMSSRFSLDLFDLSGRSVRRIAEGVGSGASTSSSLGLNDDQGRRLRDGMYFVRLTTEEGSSARELIVLH